MSDQMYERGTLAAHSSDDSGLPDVGMSVGLGYGQMLYVGEVPGLDEMGIAIYTQSGRIDVGYATDVDAAHAMMRDIAAAIRKHDAQDQALTTLAREGQRWDEPERLRAEIATLKSKAAKQRNEIARLTQALEVATEEKRRAVDELKWMRGEK